MSERYVIEVYGSSEYDSDFNLYNYLYVVLNQKTVNAYNMVKGDLVVCKVMRVFEHKTVYKSGIRNNTYALVSRVNKDFDFDVFSYTNMVGGKMYGLKISQSFIESVGVREGDYIDFNLLLLKQKNRTTSIYPESERFGYKPYDFNDSDYEELK